SAAIAHLRPLAFLPDWHVPAASQYCAPAQGTVAVMSCEPACRFTQVPSLPATLHAWQVLVHALLQQMPSTQRLLPHSLAAAHVLPFDFLCIPHVALPVQYWSWLSQGVVALWSTEPAIMATHEPSLPALLHW